MVLASGSTHPVALLLRLGQLPVPPLLVEKGPFSLSNLIVVFLAGGDSVRALDVIEIEICIEKVFLRAHDGFDMLHSDRIKLVSQYDFSAKYVSGHCAFRSWMSLPQSMKSRRKWYRVVTSQQTAAIWSIGGKLEEYIRLVRVNRCTLPAHPTSFHLVVVSLSSVLRLCILFFRIGGSFQNAVCNHRKVHRAMNRCLRVALQHEIMRYVWEKLENVSKAFFCCPGFCVKIIYNTIRVQSSVEVVSNVTADDLVKIKVYWVTMCSPPLSMQIQLRRIWWSVLFRRNSNRCAPYNIRVRAYSRLRQWWAASTYHPP